ncbi:riboflavin transporter 2-like [Ornithodoros turicata]|uniref:riboflavin transporter 2-like n=1 Tax=Ornithodoros turicata TaxID=34597 RepID=UPI003139E8F3
MVQEKMSVASKTLLSAASLLFGISSWVSINGLWVELPLLVPLLPEGWNLGAIVVIVIQVANFGPLIYTLAHARIKITPAIHGTLFVGFTASVLLACFWRETVGGHSVAFITLVAFMGFVDCTSSVLYTPFMARYPPAYLFWYLVGEGMSGLVPAGLALIQGAGETSTCANVTSNSSYSSPSAKQPRFSVDVFLALLSVVMAISWGSFAVLAHLPAALKHQVEGKKERPNDATTYGATDNLGYVNDTGDSHPTEPGRQESGAAATSHSAMNQVDKNHRKMATAEWVTMLSLQFIICAFSNGVLPGVQTYTSLPYGQVPYHIATNLATIANPLACAVAGLLQLRKLSGLVALAVGGFFCAAYLLALALLSPDPPLVGSLEGSALMVAAWVLFVALQTYVKASIASCLMAHGGASFLLWYGAATQSGSFSGAIITFLVVTYTSVFTPGTPSC